MKKLSLEEYLCALEKMKKSPRDRVGILGELGVTGLGVTAGAALSGSIALGAGAATLAGSTTLASIMGGIFLTTTPVGWIAGSALAGGAIAYAAVKLVRSGAKCDVRRNINIRELEMRIEELKQESELEPDHQAKMTKVITSIQFLVSNGFMSQEKATAILGAIEKRTMSVDETFKLFQSVVKEKSGIKENDAQQITPGDG